MGVRLKSALLFATATIVVAAIYPSQSFIIPFHVAVTLVAIFFSALFGFLLGTKYLHGGVHHFILKIFIYPLTIAFGSIFIATLTCIVSYPIWRHLDPSVGDLPSLGPWAFSSSLMITLYFLQEIWPPTLPLFLAAAGVLVRLTKPASNNSFKPRPLRGSA